MNFAVLTVSDRAANGDYEDLTGPQLVERLQTLGDVKNELVADEQDMIEASLRAFVAQGVDVVFTTGGTGFSPRDVTPEATTAVIERAAPGFGELMRATGATHTPYAYLSRSVAGIASATLIVNLPGSTKGAHESLDAVLPLITHAVEELQK